MEWLLRTTIAAIILLIGAREVFTNVRVMVCNDAPDIEKESRSSKHLLSPYTRYWIGRYYGPFEGVVFGLLLMVVAVIMYFYK